MGSGASAHQNQGGPSEEDDDVVPTYIVSARIGNNVPLDLPERFMVKLNRESMSFEDEEGALLHIPYQLILCWGSNDHLFQFKVFGNVVGLESSETVSITLNTTKGREVEEKVMGTVKSLMKDMEGQTVSKADFTTLKKTLRGEDPSDWLIIISQFSIGKSMLGKQGLDLVTMMGEKAPFDKLDVAVLVYDRLMEKDSFQLILNQFDHLTDRENILLRLGISESHCYQLNPESAINQEKIELVKAKKKQQEEDGENKGEEEEEKKEKDYHEIKQETTQENHQETTVDPSQEDEQQDGEQNGVEEEVVVDQPPSDEIVEE